SWAHAPSRHGVSRTGSPCRGVLQPKGCPTGRRTIVKVLVTGHNGYIGQVMVPLLRQAGHDVVGLDTFYYEGCQFSDEVGPEKVIREDLRDVKLTDLECIDAVIALAAPSTDALGDLRPQLTYGINHLATVNLAESAKQAGVGRFLFSSSCSLYGAAGDEHLTEEATFNPLTPYGESKIKVEQDLAQLADEAFSPVYLRNATAYGVSPSLRADLMANNLVGYALTTGKVLIKSDGMPWRPLIHIEDISRAFLAALEAPREAVHDRAFNVGVTAENYRVKEVADIVAQVVPGSVVEYAPGASPDARNYRVDFSRIADEPPAFTAKWTVPTGIEELYRAYRAHGLSAEEFTSARYLRIRTVLNHQEAGRLDEELRWR